MYTNRSRLVSPFLFVLIAMVQMAAGCSSSEEDSKKDIEKIIELAKANDLGALANFIVYRGPDKARKWKDSYDVKDGWEKERVDSMAESIRKIFSDDSSYEFGKFQKKTQSEGEWHVWEISVKNKSETKTVIFAMLKIGDHYVIGDID